MDRLRARIGHAGIDPHGQVYVDLEFYELDAPGGTIVHYPTQRVPIDPEDDLSAGAERVLEAIALFGRSYERLQAVQHAIERYIGAEIHVLDEIERQRRTAEAC